MTVALSSLALGIDKPPRRGLCPDRANPRRISGAERAGLERSLRRRVGAQ
jgi:hypothetical protein